MVAPFSIYKLSKRSELNDETSSLERETWRYTSVFHSPTNCWWYDLDSVEAVLHMDRVLDAC